MTFNVDRRKVLLSCLGIGAVPVSALAASPAPARKWGLVDVTKHLHLMRVKGIELRVFVADQDVTSRCYRFDDEFGYCMMHKKDEQGHSYYDKEARDVATEVVTDFEVRAFPCSRS